MKYLKRFEYIYTINNKSKFLDIGWNYKYYTKKSRNNEEEISIKNDNINIFINKDGLVISWYQELYFSFDFIQEFDSFQNFEVLNKIVNDVVKYCELFKYTQILIDNEIIEEKLPNMEDVEMFNKNIEKLIPVYDYLFSGKDMGLL